MNRAVVSACILNRLCGYCWITGFVYVMCNLDVCVFVSRLECPKGTKKGKKYVP